MRRRMGGAFGYALFRAAALASRGLPRRVSYALARRVSDLFHATDRYGRTGVMRNLEQILTYRRGTPPALAEQRCLARRTYRNFGMYLVDFFRYSLGRCAELDGRVSADGVARIDECLARGRGLILVTAHLGNWELGALVLGRMGYELTAAFRPYGGPRLDRFLCLQRARRGIRLLPLGRSVRGLIQTIRRGGAIALLADRDFTSHVLPAPFFGRAAPLPAGPVRLATRTGAMLLPAFLVRSPEDGYSFRFGEPMDPRATAGGEAQMQAGIALAMERAVGDDPDQWFVFHDYWAETE